MQETTEGRRRRTGTVRGIDSGWVFVRYAQDRNPMANVRRFKAHLQSAPGDFYVVNGECISCGAPHAVAPDLIGWATNVENEHCIWKKQPETPEELEQALAAFDASEIGCYRYAGGDPQDSCPESGWITAIKPQEARNHSHWALESSWTTILSPSISPSAQAGRPCSVPKCTGSSRLSYLSSHRKRNSSNLTDFRSMRR